MIHYSKHITGTDTKSSCKQHILIWYSDVGLILNGAYSDKVGYAGIHWTWKQQKCPRLSVLQQFVTQNLLCSLLKTNQIANSLQRNTPTFNRYFKHLMSTCFWICTNTTMLCKKGINWMKEGGWVHTPKHLWKMHFWQKKASIIRVYTAVWLLNRHLLIQRMKNVF